MSGGADGITDMDADHGNMDDAQPDSADMESGEAAIQSQIWKRVLQTQQMTVQMTTIDPNEELVPIDEAPGMSADVKTWRESNDTGIERVYIKNISRVK